MRWVEKIHIAKLGLIRRQNPLKKGFDSQNNNGLIRETESFPYGVDRARSALMRSKK